jgi:hypothetical protein
MIMGWSVAQYTDFSGYQLEIIFFYVIALVLAIWVFYNSDHYFHGFSRYILIVLTLVTGPIGLIVYLIFRKRVINKYGE